MIRRRPAHLDQEERTHRRFYRLAHLVSRLSQRPRRHAAPFWVDLRRRADDLCRQVAAQCQADPSRRSRRLTFAAGCAQMRELAAAAWSRHRGLPPPERIEILATGSYLLHHASCQDGAAVRGQITKIRALGEIAYVREDYDIGNSFLLPSNARVGLKERGPSSGWSVLALCATPKRWQDIARLVHTADGLERRVVRNRRFTTDWAEAALAPRQDGSAPGRDLTAYRRF